MRTNVLKGKIVSAGYTQRTLAPLLNMSENTLSKKVNGQTPFDTDDVVRLCELLNIVDNEEKAYIFLQ